MQMPPTSYKHILKYTGLFGSVQVITLLISVVRNKFAALLIGTAGVGLADLFSRTSEMLSTATGCGLSLSAVRRLSELHEAGDCKRVARQVRLIRSWLAITALLGIIAGIAAAPLLSRLVMHDAAYTAHFMLLSLLAAATTLTGGEMAILKALRQMRLLARITTAGALCTLCICVACYWLLGLDGVLPSLVLSGAALYLLFLAATVRLVPWAVTLRSTRYLKCGLPLLKLGIGFVAAGVLTALAELIVRTYISSSSSIAELGLFAAGCTLTVSYARLVFLAFDADYYPRLSAVNKDVAACNLTINRQINICLLLMTPLLLLIMPLLPLLIRLLYSENFLPVAPMVLLALPSMYFKAIYTPIAYLTLAKGHSTVYFFMEAAYNAFFVVAIAAGYRWGGLIGAGIGLTVANALDLLNLSVVYGHRYGFRFQRGTATLSLSHFLLLCLGLWAAYCLPGIYQWLVPGASILLSLCFSYFVIRR